MTFFELQEVQLENQKKEDTAAAILNKADSKASLWIHK